MNILKPGRRKKQLFIVGAGGHGKSLASVSLQSGFSEIEFLYTSGPFQVNSDRLFPLVEDLFKKVDKLQIAIAIGDNFKRSAVYKYIQTLSSQFNVELNLPNIVHPKSNVGRGVILGMGNQIFPNSNLGAHSSLGNFNILNHLSSLDHESSLSSFSSLAPGAVTGGEVRIGSESALLLSSSVSPRITIGDNSVLAANSFLRNSMGDNELYGGSPANLIRKRQAGEDYL